MKAKDYRARARQSLEGKWGLAIGTTFVAAILGGTSTVADGGSGGSGVSSSDIETLFGDSTSSVVDESSIALEQALDMLISNYANIIIAVLLGLAVISLVQFILGGATKTGLCRFNKNLYHNTEPKLNDIFTHYNIIGKTLWANILMFVFIMLWTLCFAAPGLLVFIISLSIFETFPTAVTVAIFMIVVTILVLPGICASLSYMMTFYILDENPEMTARQAITASKNLMDGHRWQLFCLGLSFIGWGILSALTLGIGTFFLNPYYYAAEYAFYHELAHGDEELEEIENDENAVIPSETEVIDVSVEEAPVVEEITENEVQL